MLGSSWSSWASWLIPANRCTRVPQHYLSTRCTVRIDNTRMQHAHSLRTYIDFLQKPQESDRSPARTFPYSRLPFFPLRHHKLTGIDSNSHAPTTSASCKHCSAMFRVYLESLFADIAGRPEPSLDSLRAAPLVFYVFDERLVTVSLHAACVIDWYWRLRTLRYSLTLLSKVGLFLLTPHRRPRTNKSCMIQT